MLSVYETLDVFTLERRCFHASLATLFATARSKFISVIIEAGALLHDSTRAHRLDTIPYTPYFSLLNVPS